jgi:adenosylmethionine-8-amino-7-oxononanoate aminotransferase
MRSASARMRLKDISLALLAAHEFEQVNNTMISDFDSRHLWHPYASLPTDNSNLLVESAHGCLLKLNDGSELIDGMSSWWTAIHGYNNPVLNTAISSQLEKMAHVMFGGLTHQPAIELGQTLLKILPKNLEQIFYCDSGSISVEVAMKMAIQCWHNQGQSSKKKFVTFRNGYHGDTLHAMSVCDPVSGMHGLFKSCLPEQIFVSAPKMDYDQSVIDELESVFSARSIEIAAFICEPVVQGAGGMRFYDLRYLKEVKKLCAKYNVLLIFDEIATGFGRTGELFISNQVEPDILCIGKALTGGYLSLAATITTKQISQTIGTLMHGPTFMGNPLACAVANASINLLLKSNWNEKILRIEEILKARLLEIKNYSNVADVRVLGAIGVIEFKSNIDVLALQKIVVENGVWLRPFRNLLYTMPPYIISEQELNKICDAMIHASQ